MTTSGIPALDELLGGQGYPEKSTVLLIGPPGIGKEALGYWFTQSGIAQDDFSLYVTRLSSREVLNDTKAFGVEFSQKPPFWISTVGGQVKFDVNDLASVSYSIKDVLKKNADRKIRIVMDALSSLLMLNPPEIIYKFLSQLFLEVKQYDAVLLATLEEGMHRPDILTSMQQLFDGFIEMSFYRTGLNVIPLLRIGKMRGVAPQPDYFRFQFSRGGLSLGRASTEPAAPLIEHRQSGLSAQSPALIPDPGWKKGTSRSGVEKFD